MTDFRKMGTLQRAFIPYVGFKYFRSNKSLIIQQLSRSIEGVRLTEDQFRAYIAAITNYTDAINAIAASDRPLAGDLYSSPFMKPSLATKFHKFVSQETFDGHISKGEFQLGTLKQYREIERKESRDVKEGLCNLRIWTGSREITVSVFAGSNYYVLCGTANDVETSYLSGRFGKVKMTISDVKSFANAIMKAIGARSWYLANVEYSDLKAYQVDDVVNDVSKVNSDFSEELFDLILKHATLPSIYVKPRIFLPENELRLSFEMHSDVKRPLKLNNKGLLRYIKFS